MQTVRDYTQIKLLLLLGGMMISGLLFGRYPIALGDLFGQAANQANALFIIWQVRLPRVLTAVVVGSALSVAGVAYQTLFRNPLAAPSTLGASAGAACGAMLAILWELNYLAEIGLSFAFGMFSMVIVFIIARQFEVDRILGLLLTGMVVTALFQGLISLFKLLADPLKTLPEMTYWLFGSLAGSNFRELLIVGAIVISCSAAFYLLSFRLNILAMGHDEASTMGIDSWRLTAITVVLATTMTASSVAISGLIGWIGLIIPHISRRLVGHDLRRLLPTAALIGSSFLIAIDLIARSVHSSEIPVGILISLIGAPLFLFMLMRRRAHD